MTSDYADNWDALPSPIQLALEPLVAAFDAGADLLFDRRLNLSFEAAVQDLSVPGIVLLTDGFRALGSLLDAHVSIVNSAEGTLLFDHTFPLTAYDLPFYAPCLYLSQLAHAMQDANVRIWKDATARELVSILLQIARCLRPDIEAARVCAAALHDMALLAPSARPLLEEAARLSAPAPNASHLATVALQMLDRRQQPL